ncbi:unnamed protein product [Polarella glacialis]|uniref:Calmodulin n=1 Tax=Polarella glacialis TaxID=89957 RepID=A0A813FW50_POLGL|nr:unnamed protein product [Polarella glacialis]
MANALKDKDLASMLDARVENDLRKIIRASNGSGHVSYEEFKSIVKGEAGNDSYHKVRMAFRIFDKDKNGLLSEDEFMKVFKSIDKSMTEEGMKSLFLASDSDADGMVSIEEFLDWVGR